MQSKRIQKKLLVEYLRATIGEQAPGYRLPSAATLGTRFGLSRVTVSAVMRPFVARGELVRRVGSGTYVAPLPSAEPATFPLAGQGSSAERFARTLEAMITDGVVRQGQALPSVKYLARTYRVSDKTVIAAYRRLVAKGLVVKVGKRFWNQSPGEIARPRGMREVFLLVHDEEELRLVFSRRTFGAIYRLAEDMLCAHGYTVRYAFFADLERLSRQWKRTPPFGLLCYHANETDMAVLSRHVRPLRTKYRGNMPVLIEWHPRDLNRTPYPFPSFSMQQMTLAIARTLADFIGRNGFRAADLIMRQECFYGKEGEGLVLIDFLWIMQEVLRIQPGCKLRLAVIKDRPENTLEGFLAYRAKKSHIVDVIEMANCIARGAPDRMVFVDSLEQLVPPRRDSRFLYITHLDEDAAGLLALLARAGIDVPRRVSLISTDNDPSYYHLGISRCEIDWYGLGSLMAHAIIQDFPVRFDHRNRLPVRAQVLEKLTHRAR